MQREPRICFHPHGSCSAAAWGRFLIIKVRAGAASAAGCIGIRKLPGGGDMLSVADMLWSGYPPRPPLPRTLPRPRALESP